MNLSESLLVHKRLREPATMPPDVANLTGSTPQSSFAALLPPLNKRPRLENERASILNRMNQDCSGNTNEPSTNPQVLTTLNVIPTMPSMDTSNASGISNRSASSSNTSFCSNNTNASAITIDSNLGQNPNIVQLINANERIINPSMVNHTNLNVNRGNVPAITLNTFTSNVINQTNTQNVSFVPVSMPRQQSTPYILQSDGRGGLQLVAQTQPLIQRCAMNPIAVQALPHQSLPHQTQTSNLNASASMNGLVLTNGTGLLLKGSSRVVTAVPSSHHNVHSHSGSDNAHTHGLSHSHTINTINPQLQAALLSSNAQRGTAPVQVSIQPSQTSNRFSFHSISGNSGGLQSNGNGVSVGGHVQPNSSMNMDHAVHVQHGLSQDMMDPINPNLHKRASCHQCKTKKDICILFYCTKTRPFSNKSFKTKKCRKKYCRSCMGKYYLDHDIVHLHRMKDSPNWQWKCPACLLICTCRACRRSMKKKVEGEQPQQTTPTSNSTSTSSTTGSPSLDEVIKSVMRSNQENPNPGQSSCGSSRNNQLTANIPTVDRVDNGNETEETGAESKPINIQHLLHLLDSSC